MTEARLKGILTAVGDKYKHLPRELGEDLIIKDVCAVIRGLNRQENFLDSFSVDFSTKTIVCYNPKEELKYISFLPYLHKEMHHNTDKNNVYVVYTVYNDTAYLEGAMSFIDSRDAKLEMVGFDLLVYKSVPIGFYNPNTNEFFGEDD